MDGAIVQLNGLIKDKDGNDYTTYPIAKITDTTVSEQTAYTINMSYPNCLSAILFNTANMQSNGTVKYKITIKIAGIIDSIKTDINDFKHDELIFDCVESERELVSKIVTDKMENAIKIDVPIKVSHDFGNDWYETK